MDNFLLHNTTWQDKDYFFKSIMKALDVYLNVYLDTLDVGDFNTSESEQVLNEFLNEHNMKVLYPFKHV